MEVDFTEFNKAAEEVIKYSEKTYPEWINGRMLAISSRALKTTEKANADAIAIQMGQIATKISKSGKRVGRIYDTSQGALMNRIINARRKKAGLPMIWGDELDRAAKKMVASRLKAVSFIKSGWVYAIRTLSLLVGYADRQGGGIQGNAARMSGKPKGKAIPAKRVINSICEGSIENTALLTSSERFPSGHSSDPMPVASRGLQIAVNQEEIEMMEHLKKKLQPVFDQHSAR